MTGEGLITRLSRLLAVSILVLPVAVLTVSKAGAAHQHDESWGLGSYGPTGPITRSRLPLGVDTYVNDQAIVTAQHPALQDARAAWHSDIDFVDQIDYQLKFRAQTDYLETQPAHLGELLTQRPINFGYEELRLYMFDEEVAEFMRRAALGDLMEEIEGRFIVEEGSEAGGPGLDPNFVGVWQDQLDGGRIVLTLVEGTELDADQARLVVDNIDVRVRFQRDSMANLLRDRDRVNFESAAAGWGITANILPDAQGFGLQLRGAGISSLAGTLASLVQTERFTLLEAPPLPRAGNPRDLHSAANQQPGLAIRIYSTSSSSGQERQCGWGFNGNTNSYHYLVTAGHCGDTGFGNYSNDSGHWYGGAFEISQTHLNTHPRNITPGQTFVRSKTNATYDVLRAETTYANDNCYHGSGGSGAAHCEWPMRNRASHNSWEPGNDTTCASLSRSNTYRCGWIQAENWCDGGGCRYVSWIVGVQGGDSGSGTKYSNTIDGIIVGGDATGSVFNTAYDVKSQLGFDFNCAVGQFTMSHPSSWPNCPVVNR